MIWAEMDDEDQVAAVVRLARDGNSVPVIARVLGTSNSTVQLVVREYGVVIHSMMLRHASPAQSDRGYRASDAHSMKMEAWRRATEGARQTRQELENV